MPEFIRVFDCSECPCLSRCRDDNDCNLSNSLNLLWTKDKELIYCATDCDLISVAFKGGVFKKVSVMATKTRPEHWQAQ